MRKIWKKSKWSKVEPGLIPYEVHMAEIIKQREPAFLAFMEQFEQELARNKMTTEQLENIKQQAIRYPQFYEPQTVKEIDEILNRRQNQ